MDEGEESLMSTTNLSTVAVWDPLVRICHWLLVVAFFIAYFTEDELLSLHVWTGYAVGCIVVLRVLWGLIGPTHARFSDFIFGPWKVWNYMLDLLRFRAERHLGHSPAGGAMVVALFIGLAATVWSGLETYAIKENAGPLANASAIMSAKADTPAFEQILLVSDEDEHESPGDFESGREDGGADDFWEEAHEVLSNVTLAFVVLHIVGVGLASAVHRENLVRAMVTGRKRAE